MVQSPKAPSAVVNPVFEADDDSIELVDTKTKGAPDAKEKPVSGNSTSGNSSNNSRSSNGIAKRAVEEPEQANGFVSTGSYYDVPQSEKLILADGKWTWCNRKRLLLAAAAVVALAVLVVVVCVTASTAGRAGNGDGESFIPGPRVAAVHEASDAPEVSEQTTRTTAQINGSSSSSSSSSSTSSPEPQNVTEVDKLAVVGVQLAGPNAHLGRGSVQLVLANGSSASVHIRMAVSNVMSVICRQLNSSTPLANALAGTQDSSTNISNLWLVGASCLGNETSISQCRNLTWGCQRGIRCRGSDDVLAIGCSSGQVTTMRPAITTPSTTRSTASATRGASTVVQATTPVIARGTSIPNASARSRVAVRLSGSAAAWSGRVEVNRNGTWIAVCGQNWNQRTAGVICRQLYRSEGNVVRRQPGLRVDPSLSTWSSMLNCSGDEATLEDCDGSEIWTPSTCSYSDNIWITCDGPALRLVGGSSPDRGRLEVFNDGLWGLVCSSEFGPEDADVACRQLGLGSGSIYSSAVLRYWDGIALPPTDESQPTWLSNVSCVGNESRLSDCPHNGWNRSNGCSQGDVIIRCQPVRRSPTTTTTPTSIGASSTSERSRQTAAGLLTMAPGSTGRGLNLRLVGSSYSDRGRLEVLYNGIWGLVCSTGFDQNDATVACRQLGLGSGSLYNYYFSRVAGGVFTPEVNNSQPIWMSQLACFGNESRLDECPHNGWNITGDCTRNNDVAIECEALGASVATLQPTTMPATTGKTTRDTAVASLVTRTAAAAATRVTEAGTTRVTVRTAATIASTTRTNVTTPRISVTRIISTTATAVRTTTATTRRNTAATRTSTSTTITTLTPTRANTALTIATTTRMPSLDNASSIELRLVGGTDSTKGRLEVLYQGQWGLVCSSGFDDADAIVACRQLGYWSGTVLSSWRSSRIWAGVFTAAVSQSTPIWMSAVSCNGTELYLHQCPHSGWNVTRSCSVADDVAIQCTPLTTVAAPSTRLTTPRPTTTVAGSATSVAADNATAEQWSLRLLNPEQKRGVLQVLYNGAWGAVCISGSHDEYDAAAKLACQQLNFSTGYVQSDNGELISDYALQDLRCNGNETSLTKCNYNSTPTDCDSDGETLNVQCMERLEERMRGIRLVDGHDNSSGYVQLNVNGSWGFVCGKPQVAVSGWDIHDAEVLCRQLGIIRSSPRLLSSRRRPQLSLSEVNFVADAFNCNGEEPTLWDCPRVQVAAYRSMCGITTQHAVYAHCEPLN